MSGETGNFVVKVDVKENVEEGPMMANTESGYPDVPNVFKLPKVIGVGPRLLKGYSNLIASWVRLG
jgi:hypothetical protein